MIFRYFFWRTENKVIPKVRTRTNENGLTDPVFSILEYGTGLQNNLVLRKTTVNDANVYELGHIDEININFLSQLLLTSKNKNINQNPNNNNNHEF